MSSSNLYNLSFTIKKLSLLTKAGEVDITQLFEVINIHDSIFSPCVTGSIIISDSVGFSRENHLDGTESLDVEIEKRDCVGKIKKRFRVYKQTRIQKKDNNESLVLHFVSPEWIKSKEKKIFSCYSDTYSNIVKKLLLLETSLGIDPKDIDIEDSEGIRDITFSGKSPISCILDCTKKAIKNSSPTFMFFENVKGFKFKTLLSLSLENVICDINFEPKSFYGTVDNSFFGARKMEVVAQHNLLQNIESGIHGATHVAFNPLERSIKINSIDLRSLPGLENITGFRHNPNASRSYQSALICHATQGGFIHSDDYKEKDSASINSEDNTLQYIAQRPALLKSYTGTRIRLEMPGNFDLSSGYMVNFKKSIAGMRTESNDEDLSLSGKYMIIASRNIIRYDSHITVIEIATNTTKDKLYQPIIRDDE